MYKLLVVAFFALLAVTFATEVAKEDQKADDFYYATYGAYAPYPAAYGFGLRSYPHAFSYPYAGYNYAYGAYPYAYKFF